MRSEKLKKEQLKLEHLLLNKQDDLSLSTR